jgi:hypothetical protein
MVATYAPGPRQPVPGPAQPRRRGNFFDRERRPDPSPEEIAAACAEIREGWSEAEHRIRAGLAPVDENGRAAMIRHLKEFGNVGGWTPPVHRCSAPRKVVAE